MTEQTEHSDEALQLPVLSLVLVLHPKHLSAEELEREMLAERQDFRLERRSLPGGSAT
jgi:hypothetical protein